MSPARKAEAWTARFAELLARGKRDPRRKVQQAAGSALRNLAKGEPDRVVPAVRSWLKDERKLVASLALRGRAK